MSEVKAIEAVDSALGGLDPAARARVLLWAQQKYGVATKAAIPQHEDPQLQTPTRSKRGAAKTKTPKASKKAKTTISMDKTLNLKPSGKISAEAFAAQKMPTNAREKCVVAVYYLRDVIEMEKVTAQAVLTYFKHLHWPVPSNLKNMLAQAGSAGWLDTADSDDLKVTSSGENLVEHDLPSKLKAKAA